MNTESVVKYTGWKNPWTRERLQQGARQPIASVTIRLPMDSVVDGTGGEPPSSQPIGGTSKSWDDVSTLPGMATDDDPFDEADPPPPPPPTVSSWLLPLGLGGAALLIAQYRLLSTYSDLLLPIGAILIVIGLAKAFLAYQRLKHARALRAAAAEAEELAHNPRTFTPAEYATSVGRSS